MSKKNSFALASVMLLLFSSPAFSGSEQERFNDLCWSWTDPPQNITEEVCACMYRKVSSSESLKLKETLNIPKVFWEKIPSSRPSNAAETATQEIFKMCFADVRKRIIGR